MQLVPIACQAFALAKSTWLQGVKTATAAQGSGLAGYLP